MSFYELKETEFLDSMKNEKRPGQVGQDQADSIAFAFQWVLPRLNEGQVEFYLSLEVIENELSITRNRAKKCISRLRKGFLTLVKKQAQGRPAVYRVNEEYIKPGKIKQSDLYHMWSKQKGGSNVKFLSCYAYCHRKKQKATVKNLLAAGELWEKGLIPWVKVGEVKSE